MPSSHTQHTVDHRDAEVLCVGTPLVDCSACGSARVADEQCPCGYRPDHRGRRTAPRRRLDEVLVGTAFGDGLAELADAALEGRLARAQVVA